MNHPRIEIKKYWKQDDPDALQRINKILDGCTTLETQGKQWYAYLSEQLEFPFHAYIEEPKRKANQMTYHRIKVIKFAEENRGGFDMICVVGHPANTDRVLHYFFLNDCQSVETTLAGYQAVQDYFYWLKKI